MKSGKSMTLRLAQMTLLLAATASMTVACGKKGAATPKSGNPEVDNQMAIEKAMVGKFGSTYDRMAPENIELAGRIDGASAAVRIMEKAAGGDAKAVKAEKAPSEARVLVKFLLKDGTEVVGIGQVQAKAASSLKIDAPADQKFMINAGCVASDCRTIIALLTQKDTDAQGTAIERKVAVIFHPDKSAAKAGKDAAEGTTDSPEQKAAANYLSAQPKEVQKLVVKWIASGDAKNYKATVRSVEEVKELKEKSGQVPAPNQELPMEAKDKAQLTDTQMPTTGTEAEKSGEASPANASEKAAEKTPEKSGEASPEKSTDKSDDGQSAGEVKNSAESSEQKQDEPKKAEVAKT